MGLDHVWSTMGLVSWWWLLGARLEGVSYEARMRLGGCHTGVQCGVRHPTQLLHLSFFFLFFFFNRFTSTQLDSRRFALNWEDSARIMPYRPNRVVLAGNRKKPKSTLNHAGIAKIGFEWGQNILNMPFLNFILNSSCFFCVLCFLPSYFFALWIKA